MMQKVAPVSLRIMILGAQEAGKSALTVRFLTQRFIGEYSSQKDLLYCSQTQIDSIPVDLEILDTSRDQTERIPREKIQWADSYIVVFSVASRSSFIIAADCLRYLSHEASIAPVLLLGNKKDLEHRREISAEEGQRLAADFGCQFAEVSAAESHIDITSAFRILLKETRDSKSFSSPAGSPNKRKISVVSVSKIISAVFGRNSNGTEALHHHHSPNHEQRLKKRPSLSL